MTPRPPMPPGTHGAITVARHGDGWQARTYFRGWDGQRRRLARHGRTKAEAERSLKAAVVEAASAGDHAGPSSRFSELAAEWLAEVEGEGRLTESTLRRYRDLVVRYVDPGLGALRCREVTTVAVDRFLRAVAASNGPATAKGARTVLSSIVKHGMRRGAMATNPVRDAGVIRAERKPSRALTDDEQAALLAALEGSRDAVQRDLPDLCRFLAGTGMRLGEACALLEDDFDLEAGVVTVRATAIRGQRVERTKSQAGHRVLALPADLVQLVGRRVENDDLATQVAVFCSERGFVRDTSNTTGQLRRAFDAAGFPWVTSHTFRKTVATRLDAAGLSARAIADHLGHAQPSMTLDVYMGRSVASSEAAVILAGQ